MINTLTLIRGLPGSGKSTLGLMIKASSSFETFCLEADSYFYDEWGNYIFDATQLHKAHTWCQEMTKQYLESGANVIVSNTFTTLKEMAEYYYIAKALDIQLNVITCQGQFGNVHGVPKETLDKMEARFYHGDVIKALKERDEK